MIVPLENKKIILPDFLIVGAGKSGTTSLHYYLQEHPDIFLPEIKEAWFFQLVKNPNKEILNRLPHLPVDFVSYLKLFNEVKPRQICGEATPSYLLFHDYTIQSLIEYHPHYKDVKIIIILREPLERLLSLYRFNLLLRTEFLSFEQALIKEKERFFSFKESIGFNYILSSLYYEQVKNFYDNFPNVKVWLFDDLKNNPQKLIMELGNFLKFDPTPILQSKILHNIFNASKRKNRVFRFKKLIKKIPLFEYLHQKAKKKLAYYKYFEHDYKNVHPLIYQNIKELFYKDVRKLESLINRDLSHWLQKYK